MVERYQKHLVNLRGWLDGRGYSLALEALDFARPRHSGWRKDGVTPEFAHQVFLMNFVRCFDAYLLNPDRLFAVLALHDTVEDTGTTLDEVARRFGDPVAHSTGLMTAPEGETEDQKRARFFAMAGDPEASVGKGADRVHNVVSMVGVFRAGKQRLYIEETRDLILPMLKEARRNFPQQIPAYEMCKLMMTTHIENIERMLWIDDNAPIALKAPEERR